MSNNKKKSLDSKEFITSGSYFTSGKKQSYHFEWKIDHFNFMCPSISTMDSPLLPQEEDSENQWIIKIKRSKDTNSPTQYISFQVYIHKGIQEYVDCTVQLKSAHNQIYKFPSFHRVYKSQSSIFSSGWLTLDQLYESIQWKYNSDTPESLTIICDICVINSLDNFSMTETTLEYIEPADSVQHKKSVLKMKEYYDFHFIVKNKKFPVHRFILALESPVFNTMFQTKMSENLTATAKVDDVEPEVFEKMLNFIYEKHIDEEDLKSSVFELLYLAHKYRLQKLEFVCTNVLHKNLTIKNVINTLETAILYDISELRARALQFLKLNLNTIKSSEDFVNMIKKNPTVALDLMDVKVGPAENTNFIGKTTLTFEN